MLSRRSLAVTCRLICRLLGLCRQAWFRPAAQPLVLAKVEISRMGFIIQDEHQLRRSSTMAKSMRNPPIVKSPIRLAVCVSGQGTTLQNLIDRIRREGCWPKSSRLLPAGPGSERSRTPRPPRFRSHWPATIHGRGPSSAHSVFDPIRHSESDLVILGGFLSLLQIPADYRGRVINVHPSLIPAFCGKGFYGSKVHEAVLEAGVKLTGCTVHFVDNDYDNGPIILQRRCPCKTATRPIRWPPASSRKSAWHSPRRSRSTPKAGSRSKAAGSR